jgi:hypothetical protein
MKVVRAVCRDTGLWALAVGLGLPPTRKTLWSELTVADLPAPAEQSRWRIDHARSGESR